MWRSYDPAVIDAEIDQMRELGMTVTRSFFYWPDFQPRPDTLDEALVARFRDFLDRHSARGMSSIPTFIVGHMSGQNWDPAWREGRDLFADVWFVARQAWYVRELTARLHDHPAVAGWLQGVRFADRDLARQAIAKTVAAARALELKTLDEARALEFEAAMGKAGIAFRGVKDVLAVYGFDLDQSFSSVKAEVISEEGDQAKVKVDYQILGQPLSFETAMVRIDGRWYGKDTIEQLDKELNGPKADAAAGEAETADAGTAPDQG